MTRHFSYQREINFNLKKIFCKYLKFNLQKKFYIEFIVDSKMTVKTIVKNSMIINSVINLLKVKVLM